MPDPFPAWFAALETRHRRDLSFAEIRRALQALSSLYVERRGRLRAAPALEGAGKRAAFALYYAPLHFLLVRQIVRALGAAAAPASRVLDLGCGTGVAGAAWALEAGPGTHVEGVDRSGWAVAEANWNFRRLGIAGTARTSDLERATIPPRPAGVVAAFTLNELGEGARERLRRRLLDAAGAGVPVLVVEPLSRRVSPWWESWAEDFAGVEGRHDTWRFPVSLPETLRLLDRAAGLDHRELSGRSLFLPGRRRRRA